MTAPPPVPDEAVTQHHPFRRVKKLSQVGFHLGGGSRIGPAQTSRYPHDVGVRGDSGDAEGIT